MRFIQMYFTAKFNIKCTLRETDNNDKTKLSSSLLLPWVLISSLGRGSSQIFETQLTVTAALVLCIASLILESRVIQYNKRAGNHQHCPVLQGTVYIYYVLAVFLCGSGKNMKNSCISHWNGRMIQIHL